MNYLIYQRTSNRAGTELKCQVFTQFGKRFVQPVRCNGLHIGFFHFLILLDIFFLIKFFKLNVATFLSFTLNEAYITSQKKRFTLLTVEVIHPGLFATTTTVKNTEKLKGREKENIRLQTRVNFITRIVSGDSHFKKGNESVKCDVHFAMTFYFY
jgi:hypothetical protein